MRASLLVVCVLALLGLSSALRLSDPGLLPGEGQACIVGKARGVCSAQACAGASVSGKCPGPAAVKCCLPPSSSPSAPPKAPSKAPATTPSAAPVAPSAPATPAKPEAATKPAKPAAPAAPAAPKPPTPAKESKADAVKPAPAVTPAAPAASDASASPAAGMPPVPAGVKLLAGTPKQAWPYSFPYSKARHLVADMALQRLRLYDGDKMVKEYKISTGKLGIGNKPDRANTPWGKLRIAMKVGRGQPLGMIIEKLTPQKRIGKASDSHAHMQTRILVLEGLEAHNKNTRARSIYIHGTNRESRLGAPDSAGCFRIGNQEIVELFDLVNEGTEFYAIPYAAWPN